MLLKSKHGIVCLSELFLEAAIAAINVQYFAVYLWTYTADL